MRLYKSLLASQILSFGPQLLIVTANVIGHDGKQSSIATTLFI